MLLDEKQRFILSIVSSIVNYAKENVESGAHLAGKLTELSLMQDAAKEFPEESKLLSQKRPTSAQLTLKDYNVS